MLPRVVPLGRPRLLTVEGQPGRPPSAKHQSVQHSQGARHKRRSREGWGGNHAAGSGMPADENRPRYQPPLGPRNRGHPTPLQTSSGTRKLDLNASSMTGRGLLGGLLGRQHHTSGGLKAVIPMLPCGLLPANSTTGVQSQIRTANTAALREAKCWLKALPAGLMDVRRWHILWRRRAGREGCIGDVRC